MYQSWNLQGKRYAKQIQVTAQKLQRIYIFPKFYFSLVLDPRPCFKRDLILLDVIENENLSSTPKDLGHHH